MFVTFTSLEVRLAIYCESIGVDKYKVLTCYCCRLLEDLKLMFCRYFRRCHHGLCQSTYQTSLTSWLPRYEPPYAVSDCLFPQIRCQGQYNYGTMEKAYRSRLGSDSFFSDSLSRTLPTELHPLMRQLASVMWHLSLQLMNSLNKTEAAIPQCRLCSPRSFHFLS